MIKKHLANIITLANISTGIIVIFLSIQNTFSYSYLLLLLCVIFDFLDGKVARKYKLTSKLGAEFDSLSDLVSFGVAPAVTLFIFLPQHILTTIILIIFVLCGTFRLARFNASSSENHEFEGVPITTNGIIFPILLFVTELFLLSNIFLYGVIILMSFLMISKLKIKKF